tara:strand:- start:167 stop:1207 length:1041 start_codon:yes stop_codon:yes gene_type:complete
MSFAVSNKLPSIEYSGKTIFTLFSNLNNLFSLKFYKMIFEIKRLYSICNKLEINDKNSKLTLVDFLNEYKFSDYLKNYHILPMISSIWSSNIDDVKKFPLITFINFFKNHALFEFKNRPQWKYVFGGSNQYIKKILNLGAFKYFTNFNIIKIIRDTNSIKIIDQNNNHKSFSKLIFATHADQILSLLDNPTDNEINIFNNFKYSTNKAYLHTDNSLMPLSKFAWSSWNFLNNSVSKKFTLTYWMNLLQNLPTKKNYFVTVNPFKEPNYIINQTTYEHPIYSLNTLKAQKEVMKIQGLNNTYFCGSYLGYGFHEDGIQSAAHISKLLGCNLPWKRDKNFYNRLKLNN